MLSTEQIEHMKKNYFLIPGIQRKVTMDFIVLTICEYYNVDIGELKGGSRNYPLPFIRQVVFYFTRKYTNMTQGMIGKYLNRDHATVIYGIKKIKDLYEFDKKVKSEIDEFIRYFGQFR